MIKTKSQYITSEWSGGKTTELFIYPEGSSYQKRNFDIRISSASVEIEESTFTKLPDYNRVLMILSGCLEINHQDRYKKKLSEYSCDYFDGAWNTSSKGKVIDFNLMTSKSLLGKLEYEILALKSEVSLKLKDKEILSGIYLISGKILSRLDKQEISPGELIILDNPNYYYNLQILEESQIIKILVQ